MAATNPIYRDFSLAFGIHPIRKDIATLVNVDAVKRSVINLILTDHYDRPFHPEIGCDVHRLLFENITPVTQAYVQRSIINVLGNFEPRVSVVNVNVTPDPDNNGINISIAFTIVNQPGTATVDLFLERIR